MAGHAGLGVEEGRRGGIGLGFVEVNRQTSSPRAREPELVLLVHELVAAQRDTTYYRTDCRFKGQTHQGHRSHAKISETELGKRRERRNLGRNEPVPLNMLRHVTVYRKT